MNYRASLITFKDSAGDTHTYPAHKIKGLSGRGRCTAVVVEPVEGTVRTVEAEEAEPTLRERWLSHLEAGENQP